MKGNTGNIITPQFMRSNFLLILTALVYFFTNISTERVVR